jgi:hypothetical protein
MEVCGQLHAPAALSPGKSPLYPLDRRLGKSQSRSGRRGEEKMFRPRQGLKQVYSVVQTMTKTLYILSYSGSIMAKEFIKSQLKSSSLISRII